MSLAVRVALSALRRGTRHRYGPGPSQVADLHLPRGAGPHPVAVVLHGGHWRTGFGRLVTRPVALDLVSHGVAAWNLEYRRLGTGRGGGGGWPATFDDVAAGIDALAGVDGLDLDRVAVVGHSAGGHLALWAGARAGLPRGAPGAGPVVGPSLVVALAPVTHLRRADDAASELLGGTVEQVPERWDLADPMSLLPLSVPTLVVHPEADTTIPVARSRDYAAASGAELVTPPGEVHRDAVDPTSASWRTARARVLQW
ncbi:MAG: alpha/beta hydrolase [Mycobacteriales bacterium]|nr:alpha/beta hydrolase [Mycobacteriales bacterium]